MDVVKNLGAVIERLTHELRGRLKAGPARTPCYARAKPKENEVKVKLEVVIELGEMDVADLAKAVKMELQAMDIPNPDGGMMR